MFHDKASTSLHYVLYRTLAQHTMPKNSLVYQNMFRNFVQQRSVSAYVYAELLQYASQAHYKFSYLLALLFQTPFKMRIEKYHLDQAISLLEGTLLEHKLDKETTITEAWVELFHLNQPSAIESSNLLDELLKCFDQCMIVDLIKVIHSYLNKNVARVFVEMQLYAVDTENRLEIATIQQILWMPHKLEHFIYIYYPGYLEEWCEWLPVTSSRLKLIQNSRGQSITMYPTIDFRFIEPNDRVDYYNPERAEWTIARVSDVHISAHSCYVAIWFRHSVTYTIVHESFAIRTAPLYTFTSNYVDTEALGSTSVSLLDPQSVAR